MDNVGGANATVIIDGYSSDYGYSSVANVTGCNFADNAALSGVTSGALHQTMLISCIVDSSTFTGNTGAYPESLSQEPAAPGQQECRQTDKWGRSGPVVLLDVKGGLLPQEI
jgi:hypothetical protein